LSASLVLNGVTCIRGGRSLFERLDLHLRAGEAAVVTGANGVGKSSLIRIAAGLLAPSAGAVESDGDIALMVDAAALDPERPLADALAFWARLDGRAETVAPALAAVGLTDAADVPVRWLSSGQRRRATLARVIASGAPLWLLDEPANGMDAASVAVLEAIVATHRASGGIAIVATHVPLAIPDAIEVAL